MSALQSSYTTHAHLENRRRSAISLGLASVGQRLREQSIGLYRYEESATSLGLASLGRETSRLDHTGEMSNQPPGISITQGYGGSVSVVGRALQRQ